MVHLSKKASALEWSPSKIAGSLPLSFVLFPRSSGFLPGLATGGPPPPPPPPPSPPSPPPPSSGLLYGNPELPNQLGSGASSGGAPPFHSKEVPSCTSILVGSVVVCVAMMVVMGGSLEEAVLVLVSSVQSGLSSKFGQTETKTSLLRLKDLKRPD